jgi:hypothetical protein
MSPARRKMFMAPGVPDLLPEAAREWLGLAAWWLGRARRHGAFCWGRRSRTASGRRRERPRKRGRRRRMSIRVPCARGRRRPCPSARGGPWGALGRSAGRRGAGLGFWERKAGRRVPTPVKTSDGAPREAQLAPRARACAGARASGPAPRSSPSRAGGARTRPPAPPPADPANDGGGGRRGRGRPKGVAAAARGHPRATTPDSRRAAPWRPPRPPPRLPAARRRPRRAPS